MNLSVDIGGTKTLVVVFDDDGNIVSKRKFATNQNFDLFITDLKGNVRKIWSDNIKSITVAAPGKINLDTGEVVSFGNLPWKNVDIVSVLSKEFEVDIFIDNDANLAGLAEAHEASAEKYRKVLYVTVGTGIGTSFIVDGEIVPLLTSSEGGHMIFEHDGKLHDWEDFASGKAIKNIYGKLASEIVDEESWREIAYSLSLGFQHLIAVLQPELLVVGGSIGTYFDKYGDYLRADLKKMSAILSDGLYELPHITKAKHPQEAVVYGGYLLSKARLSK